MVTTLSEEMNESARTLALAIDADGTPVEAVFWKYEDEHERWRLRIVSPRVAIKGPLAVYRVIRNQMDLIAKREKVPFQFDDIRALEVDDPEVEEVRNMAFMVKPGSTQITHPFALLWTYLPGQLKPIVSEPLTNNNGEKIGFTARFYRLISGMFFLEVDDSDGTSKAGESFFVSNSAQILPASYNFELPRLSLTCNLDQAIFQWASGNESMAGYITRSRFDTAIAKLKKVVRVEQLR